MDKFQIIEEAIERSTGRIVDGKAVWEEMERAVGQYQGEDGRVIVVGEDNQKEKWDYWIDLKRTYDKDYDQWETEINLLEILILDKVSQKEEAIKIPWEERSMTREEFYENTKTYILGVLPRKYSSWEIEVREYRNQEGAYQGMIFKPAEGAPQGMILPVFNLDSLYNQYGGMELMDGLISMSEEIELILERNEMSDMTAEEVLKEIMPYDNVKEKLYVSVMSMEEHRDRRDGRYVVKAGIPLQARILLKEFRTGEGISTGSIEVNEMLVRTWNVSFHQVMEDAMKNTERLMPTEFMSIYEPLREMMGEEQFAETMGEMEGPEMYVLTNRERNRGAVNLFLPGVMERIAEQFGDSYFALPSSIHETLLIPLHDVNGGAAALEDIRGLKEIVRQGNETQVPPQERLSDNVYFFDAGSKMFLNAEEAVSFSPDHKLVSEKNEKETGTMEQNIPYPAL